MKFTLLTSFIFLIPTIILSEKIAISTDSLRVRDKPSLNSNVIRLLNTGDSVQIIKRTNITETINGNKAEWLEIRLENPLVTGYIFSAFISNYSNSAEYLLEQAKKESNTNKESAMNIYKYVYKEFPKAYIDYGGHTKILAKKEAEIQIEILECQISHNDFYFSSLDEAANLIFKATNAHNIKEIQSFVHCSINFISGPISLAESPTSFAILYFHNNLKGIVAKPKINYDQNNFIYNGYIFQFSKNTNKFKWESYSTIGY